MRSEDFKAGVAYALSKIPQAIHANCTGCPYYHNDTQEPEDVEHRVCYGDVVRFVENEEWKLLE